jgi:5'(3')-deoxyribonucleotidase
MKLNELKSQKIIHLDLDGVIFNMVKRVKELTGKSFEEFSSRQEAWNEINKHQDIFKHLELMPDAEELVNGVTKFAKENGYTVEVLTAIPLMTKFPFASMHKEESVKRHFGHLGWKFKIGPYAKDKQNHCKPGDILIDDSQMNIDQWNKAGGVGILHTSAKKTLDTLKKLKI